ncbi:DUF3304 domain-containing protein [Rhodoferax aquaticus]|uniref:DUF3304 domain-containing protein n=1 Tax=Rhodoferax aquaticus TaxID=2527691 RepID=A0A515EJS3_9BURK|nr:DUF3304 domain-containing protein [Rhodoferax aquaticus]QDL52925.1 DUF3304 domain-containing protein [Rhodoferax aquaticus]
MSTTSNTPPAPAQSCAAGNKALASDGHHAWADDTLQIHPAVTHCEHCVAAHELDLEAKSASCAHGMWARSYQNRSKSTLHSLHTRCTRSLKRMAHGVRKALAPMAAVLALAALTGCAEPTSSAGVTGYNHTSNRSIYTFSVNGSMGMMLLPESGGGGTTCCTTIPSQWRPGIKVKVRWVYQGGTELPPAPPPQEAEVELPRYKQNDIDRLAVHFFPDHKVKVLVTPLGIRHPDYPADLRWDAPTPPDAVQATPSPAVQPATQPSAQP